MRRIRLLTILSVMLATGLGMIVLLVRIIPLNADARFPLALTGSVMVIAGFITIKVLTRLAHRNA